MRSRRPSALALVLLALTPAAGLAQRLPVTVVPEHYALAFDVDLAGATFGGTETIRVQLKEPLRRITLHALDMQFQQVTITAAGEEQTVAATFNAPTETVALTVPNTIPAGPADIRIRYTGILNDKLRGFYLSKANGRNYAVTQMESTDARRAFPSFDEPAYKATFDITLTIDANDSAISNGALVSDVPGPGAGRHTLTFATTPKMSSYLVAMAVGDFVCTAGEADTVPIRICATPDKKDLGHIALDAAEQILQFYNRYYAITYPFGKLDVVAVPDFAAGAMENTAAIFYREVDLLADDKTASVANRQRIWEVLAHEMAHQWFGDLVTMRWWDDLWLNEGFATWMEKRPLASLKPEWKMDVAETSDTHSAMNLDSLASTRAIHSAVETPAEIEGSFDTIAYQKGGAVMSMIEGYVGDETFRRGVNLYLERHAYANATSEDFWTAVTEASDKPVDKILPTFVNQPGIPLITVGATCTSAGLKLDLAQQRFFLTPPSSGAFTRTTWNIPVCMKDARGGSSCTVLDSRTLSRTLTPSTDQKSPAAASGADACPAWVFLNAGAKGYYRTQYPPAMLRAMAPDLQTTFTASERFSLVGDEWALVRAGTHTVADYMTIAAGFGREESSTVFEEVGARLAFIHDYLTTDATRGPFERFLQQLVGPAFDALGFTPAPGEDDDQRTLRADL
ncbi:MAG: M1 family metallopeptidase, partial [Acidobacteriaceae bacterium]|nr:M1 family metallopeptidase [Acidobacteriaceae bacterium]